MSVPRVVLADEQRQRLHIAGCKRVKTERFGVTGGS
jgi:hypothetical protein